MTRTKLEQTVDEAEQAFEGIDVKPHGVKSIRVTWGEEVIQPVQYNGFRIGGLELQIDLLPGESPEMAYERGWAILDRIGRKQFELKLKGFAERLGAAQRGVRNKG